MRSHARGIGITKRNQTLSSVFIEAMEPRRLQAMLQEWTSSELSLITDFTYLAESTWGSNGFTASAPELVLATETQTLSTARIQWDSNILNGIDSGWRPVSFSCNLIGSDQVTWNASQSTANAIGDRGDFIDKVTLRAAVMHNGMSAAWRNLTIRFYQGNELIDEEIITSGPAADTLSSNTDEPFESILELYPSEEGCDKVTISGEVRFATAEGVYPDVRDLFAQVFVHEEV
jgi:hypothetical protein